LVLAELPSKGVAGETASFFHGVDMLGCLVDHCFFFGTNYMGTMVQGVFSLRIFLSSAIVALSFLFGN